MRSIAFLILLLPLFLIAQSDSVLMSAPDLLSVPERPEHSPGKAAWLSAALPGAGQIYNKKYWKAPIAWAGLGVSYYFIRENTKQYNVYKDAYLAVIDGDPNTVDAFNGQFSSGSLLNVADTYRRWRDLSYIAIGAVYVLNVLDAAVDAYFFRFDVSDDLSLQLRPSVLLVAHQGVIPGLRLGIRL